MLISYVSCPFNGNEILVSSWRGLNAGRNKRDAGPSLETGSVVGLEGGDGGLAVRKGFDEQIESTELEGGSSFLREVQKLQVG